MILKPCSFAAADTADKENIDPNATSHSTPEVFSSFFTDLKKIENPIDLEEAYLDHYINEKIRCQVVDWVLEVTQAYKARIRTFHLCIRIIDIYCTKVTKMLPLEFYYLAVASILIAFKYEEIKPISMNSLCGKVSHGIIEKGQLVKFEKKILQELNYNVYLPTLYDFCQVLFEDCSEEEKENGYVWCDLCVSSLGLAGKKFSKLAEAIFLIVMKKEAPTQGPLALCIQELKALKESFDKALLPTFAEKYQKFLNKLN